VESVQDERLRYRQYEQPGTLVTLPTGLLGIAWLCCARVCCTWQPASIFCHERQRETFSKVCLGMPHPNDGQEIHPRESIRRFVAMAGKWQWPPCPALQLDAMRCFQACSIGRSRWVRARQRPWAACWMCSTPCTACQGTTGVYVCVPNQQDRLYFAFFYE
jgi:hypothetical protein